MYLFVVIAIFIAFAGSLKITYNEYYNKPKYMFQSKSYLFLGLFILCVLTILRRIDVGNDTISYYYIFQNILVNGISISNSLEVGFVWFTKLITNITSNYQIFITIIGLFSYIMVYLFLKKYSKNYLISLLLFFFIFYRPYINVLRQVMAISILLPSFSYLFKRKLLKYLIFVIFASLFHASALIALIFPFFLYIKYKAKYLIPISVVVFVFILFDKNIISLLNILGYTTKYFLSEFSLTSILYLLSSIFLYILLMISSKNVDNFDGRFDFYKWMGFLGILISVFGFKIWIMQRLFLYIAVFFLISIPNVLKENKNEYLHKKIVIYILIFYGIYHYIIYFFRPEWATEFPYHFFF